MNVLRLLKDKALIVLLFFYKNEINFSFMILGLIIFIFSIKKIGFSLRLPKGLKISILLINSLLTESNNIFET